VRIAVGHDPNCFWRGRPTSRYFDRENRLSLALSSAGVILESGLIQKVDDFCPVEAVDAAGPILDGVEPPLPGPIDDSRSIDSEDVGCLPGSDIPPLRPTFTS